MLAALPDTNTLTQMATVADWMMESCSAQPSISRMLVSTPSPSTSADISPLVQTVRGLQQELRELRSELCRLQQKSQSPTHHQIILDHHLLLPQVILSFVGTMPPLANVLSTVAPHARCRETPVPASDRD